MRFDFRRRMGLLVVLLWLVSGTIFAAGGEGPRLPEITVLVYDSAGISRPVLNQAAFETTRIFRQAGIEITWVNCSGGSAIAEGACLEGPGANQFVLHIVPTGTTSTDLVFGVAFLAEDGSGTYCDVFFDRVDQATHSMATNESQLLGTVAAHELGHLLLGSHAHSAWGIMEPVWKTEGLRQIGMGTLLFLPEQSALMKARIGRAGVTLSGFVAKTKP
jgi:hypothetical protein